MTVKMGGKMLERIQRELEMEADKIAIEQLKIEQALPLTEHKETEQLERQWHYLQGISAGLGLARVAIIKEEEYLKQ